MDGFQLTIVSTAFSDSQWEGDPVARAEKRRADLREQEEQYRRAQRALDSGNGRRPWRANLRNEAMALRTRVIALRRRPALTYPIDLAPAASETT
jgi:hypothetical protein